MPSLGSLVSGLRPASAVKRSEIYLLPVNDKGGPDMGQSRAFQYFPNSIQDSKGVTYQSKEVPGGSLPMYQWTGSGERTISFTVQFTTDVDHLQMQDTNFVAGAAAGLGIAVGGSGTKDADYEAQISMAAKTMNNARTAAHERLQAAGALSRNPFIPGAILWLRSFMLPSYSESTTTLGKAFTSAPRKLWLVIPNSGIDLAGGEGGFSALGGGIFCHMATCEVTYSAFFPSGNPRAAEVSLSFNEDAQNTGQVKFPQASQTYNRYVADWYPPRK